MKKVLQSLCVLALVTGLFYIGVTQQKVNGMPVMSEDYWVNNMNSMLDFNNQHFYFFIGEDPKVQADVYINGETTLLKVQTDISGMQFITSPEGSYLERNFSNSWVQLSDEKMSALTLFDISKLGRAITNVEFSHNDGIFDFFTAEANGAPVVLKFDRTCAELISIDTGSLYIVLAGKDFDISIPDESNVVSTITDDNLAYGMVSSSLTGILLGLAIN